MTDYTTMTNDQLSAEIARRLFGLPKHPTLPGWFLNNSDADYKYSRPIYASSYNWAMGLVVDKMRKRGWFFSAVDNVYIPHRRPQESEHRTVIEFNLIADWRVRSAVAVSFGEEPRGICEAALAALDSEEQG